MKITIYAPDINLTPDINDYLEKKMSSLDRLVPSLKRGAGEPQAPVEIRVKMEKEAARGNLYKIGAEMILSRQVVSVSVQNQDVFQAIDELKDKLQREMRRSGGRREAIHRRTMRAFKRMRLWPGGRRRGGRERSE